ncbi:hypothetical protein NPIL_223871, partial [Nephila pilipes]
RNQEDLTSIKRVLKSNQLLFESSLVPETTCIRNKCHEWKYRKLKEESSNSVFNETNRLHPCQATNIRSRDRDGSLDQEYEATSSASRSDFSEFDINRPMLSYWHKHHYDLRKASLIVNRLR